MFRYYNVLFPVLLLRNSFLIVEENMTSLIKKLDISVEDLFENDAYLLSEIIKRHSKQQLTLENEINQLNILYQHINEIAGKVDVTLSVHVKAIEKKAENAIINLEKKIIRAEKRKHEEQAIQVQKLKSTLFPKNNLQERIGNMLPYYARYGKAFIDMLYQHSPTLDQKFGILIEN